MRDLTRIVIVLIILFGPIFAGIIYFQNRYDPMDVYLSRSYIIDEHEHEENYNSFQFSFEHGYHPDSVIINRVEYLTLCGQGTSEVDASLSFSAEALHKSVSTVTIPETIGEPYVISLIYDVKDDFYSGISQYCQGSDMVTVDVNIYKNGISEKKSLACASFNIQHL